MTTGPQHYRLAEDHLGYAQNSDAPDVEALHLGYAQAHATLALAAATAMSAPPGGMHAIDLEEWDRACGAQEEYDDEDAIDASAPFAVQRDQLAAADLSSTPLAVAFGARQRVPVFGEAQTPPETDDVADLNRLAEIPDKIRDPDLDDVVNVSDPEHEYFGARGVVVTIRSDGWTTIMTGSDGGEVLTLPASSLMPHAAFVAQMDAAEQRAAASDAEADLSATLPVPVYADEVPVQRSREYWSTLADEYVDSAGHLPGDDDTDEYSDADRADDNRWIAAAGNGGAS